MKNKIYISGKIGEKVTPEISMKFFNASEMIKKEFKDFEIINPVELGRLLEMRNGAVSGSLSREDYMSEDIKHLMECNLAFFLADWQSSRGAILEHDICEQCGITIIYQRS